MHIGQAAAKEGESQMIVMMGNNLSLTSIILNGDPSIEHKGKLPCLDEQVKISQFYHCEGLLLCILKDDSRFVVCNPYLEQTRWIEPRYSHRPHGWDRFSYALGYVNTDSCCYYKLLGLIDYYYNAHEKQFFWYGIYDFDSDLWTTLDVTPHWRIAFCNRGVSLKGSTYWCAAERNVDVDEVLADRLICFDFTSERFGPLLPLPFSGGHIDCMTLSCVREEKLAVLLQHDESNPYELDLWITTKIETGEEKKVAFGFDGRNRERVIVIGEAGYLRGLDLVGDFGDQECRTDLCSYVPSLVQIKQPEGGESKQQSDLEKCRYDENMLRLVSL
ncbi:F-box associated ubiquitination effector family protein [Arabidopsis thaliana]|uniref:F-box associated ubiquitination effector family protein n=1 Tax=Arabidopsis thaliana TaxID=3702 RepID=F4J466_ARATH|nr:F-box associated ubiquitination effector family protein [Arabidopsis thaliana]AEE76801.1 F-box associated ubiquitination effector family protein [Arabidopsis thaliana]|eukprot:NP_683587.1 F-box associated ubiquitination effector family protein [Arabidopsis thaliana]